MKEQLEYLKQTMSELNEAWDNDQVEHYPQTLMSFDELLIEVSKITLK